MTTFIVLSCSAVAFVVFVVLPACWLTSARRERWAEAYWSELAPPATDDPGEWTGPLHGGRSFARRMMTDLKAKGIMLPARTSAATRRFVHAVDGARRPGWMLRHRPVLRRPVWTEPAPEAPPEVHHEREPMPELLTAPLPEVFEHGLTDATWLGLLVSDSVLPPAPDPGGASPIGDALTAEMGIVPQPRDDEDSVWAPDNTTWSNMREELWAMLAQDGEVAS